MTKKISIKKLDEKKYQQLQRRASLHIDAPESIINVFRKYFGVKHGINLNLDEHRQPHEPIDFKE